MGWKKINKKTGQMQYPRWFVSWEQKRVKMEKIQLNPIFILFYKVEKKTLFFNSVLFFNFYIFIYKIHSF